MDWEHPFDTLLRRTPCHQIRVILYLGAGGGSTVLQLHHRVPDARLYAFECDPIALRECRHVLGCAGVEVVPLAVHDKTGPLRFYARGTNSRASSSLPPLDSAVTPAEAIDVDATRIDDWAKSRSLSHIDVLWCDIEGDTLAVLRGCGDLLTSVQTIYLPTTYGHMYQGRPSLRDVEDYLLPRRFHRVRHQQVLPGQWGFALYASDADTAVNDAPPAQTSTLVSHDSNSLLPFAKGGIGDLLQHIPAAIRVRSLRVYSHFARAADVFLPFAVKVTHELFHANTAHVSAAPHGEELAREYFPLFPMPRPVMSLSSTRYRRVVGLHPYGSGYANTFADRQGLPAKWMPPSFVDALLSRVLQPDDGLLVFCAPGEQPHLPLTLGRFADRACIVAYQYLWDSLSMVPSCSLLLGVDSSVKTMASILRIPTVTVVADFPDEFRDRHFLDPYVRAGVMRVIPFFALGEREAEFAAAAARDLCGHA